MTERPILYSAPMIRAKLAGTKTQTRRMSNIRALDLRSHDNGMVTWDVHFSKPIKGVISSHSGSMITELQARHIIASQFCPYGKPGDKLWARETWRFCGWTDDGMPFIKYADDNAERFIEGHMIPESASDWLAEKWELLSRPENYAIDGKAADRKWRPSIFMPRWASRITDEIVSVRVERLQDISTADCWAEGIPHSPDVDPIHEYQSLWESINGPGSWALNPWVWVITTRPANV